MAGLFGVVKWYWLYSIQEGSVKEIMYGVFLELPMTLINQ